MVPPDGVFVAEGRQRDAGGADAPDGLPDDPPGDEGQHVERGLIEEVQVIQAEEDRRPPRGVDDQLEHGERGEERVDLHRSTHREAGEQGRALGVGEDVDACQQRPDQLVEARVRQEGLGRVAPGPQDGLVGVASAGRRTGEQGALADSRVPVEAERHDVVGRGAVDVVHQEPQLGVATDDPLGRGRHGFEHPALRARRPWSTSRCGHPCAGAKGSRLTDAARRAGS